MEPIPKTETPLEAPKEIPVVETKVEITPQSVDIPMREKETL